MKKIAIIGSSGAGKSQLARAMGEALGLPVIHLDKEHWQPGWTEPPKDKWRDRVTELVKRGSWIIDGNFGGTMEIRIAAADTIVFLDLPRTVCCWRIVKRWVTYRAGTRPDMAEGCHEKFDLKFLKWVWDFPKRSRPTVLRRLDAADKNKQIIRLRTRSEVAAFLDTVLNGKIRQQN